MRLDSPEEFIAVDVGEARLGLARGSSLARLAEPLKTVAAKDGLKEIKIAVKTHDATGVVVGLPRGLNGQETPQTRSVKDWVQKAKAEIDLPFYWQDEALSSKLAEARGQTEVGSDAVAASIILQDFLDTPKEQRVRC